jgi:outer membrane receptor protein involved in Fe transport
LNGFLGGAVSYVDHRVGIFTAAASPRVYLPGYAKADLHASVKYDSWTATLYVNNVADRRGVLNGGYFPPFAFQLIQPRTVGLSLVKTF